MSFTSKQAKKRGRKGGRANTEAQNAARRENGKQGGRPEIQDEFTDLPISKAAKSARRRRKLRAPVVG